MQLVSWGARAALAGAGAALLVGAAAAPALADSVSTTGASGSTEYISGSGGYYNLYAKDTLTDGHCAQWQSDQGGWHYIGSKACSGGWEHVGSVQTGHRYRICRTGAGNCSSAVEL